MPKHQLICFNEAVREKKYLDVFNKKNILTARWIKAVKGKRNFSLAISSQMNQLVKLCLHFSTASEIRVRTVKNYLLQNLR